MKINLDMIFCVGILLLEARKAFIQTSEGTLKKEKLKIYYNTQDVSQAFGVGVGSVSYFLKKNGHFHQISPVAKAGNSYLWEPEQVLRAAAIVRESEKATKQALRQIVTT